VGAGAGLFGGTAVGSGNAQTAQYSVQKRYDASYVQCMYSKGNQVPGRAPARYRGVYTAALLAPAQRGGATSSASAAGVHADDVEHATAASAERRDRPPATGGDAAAATAGVPVTAPH
jgi:hypothetical protein